MILIHTTIALIDDQPTMIFIGPSEILDRSGAYRFCRLLVERRSPTMQFAIIAEDPNGEARYEGTVDPEKTLELLSNGGLKWVQYRMLVEGRDY